MNTGPPEKQRSNFQIYKELLLVGIFGVSFFALSSYFNLFDRLIRITQGYEQFQLNELLIVFSGLAFVGVVFSVRKGLELNKEVIKRKQLEESLRRIRNDSDVLVGDRTAELVRVNDQLKREIDVRKQVEDALGEQEALFRAIFRDSAVGITVSNLEGRPMQINPAFQKMVGYEQEELTGMFFSELTHPDDVAANIGLYEEMLEGKRDNFFMTKRYIHKKGGVVWGQVTVSLIQDTHNNPQFVIGIVEDITVRRQLEEERAKSAKLESIGLLAGGIAHDFNNLLTAILGNISLSKLLIKRGEDVLERLTVAEKATLRSRDLTHQLLTFSKGGSPIKKSVLIGELIKDLTSFSLSGSNVKYECSIPDDVFPIEADEGQISQVIQNIITNADQAMPEGGTINVMVDNCTINNNEELPLKKGDYVQISVTDQGCGISKDDLDKIFDPYFTTKRIGTGLGLSISYSIVQNHGGHIAVESEEGIGTTFRLYFPASKKGASRKKRKREDDPTFMGKGRILLMDDEEMIRDITSEALKQIGYEVEVASDGLEAIESYKKAQQARQPFEAVFLDLTVPGGMGGKETIAKLRAIDPKVKAIVSSGYYKDPVMADFRKYGFVEVILKPYRINDLRRILKSILGNSLEVAEESLSSHKKE